MAPEADITAPKAFPGHEIILPPMPGARDHIALHLAFCEVRMFVFATDFGGEEGAILPLNNTHGAGKQAK